MKFQHLPKFSRELKRFTKKYRSLPEDLSKLQAVLLALPEGSGQKHWNRLHASEDGLVIVFKVRLACASLKGQSLFRVIYAYNKKNEEVVLIDFIELYYKGEKANEDRDLIRDYLNAIN